MKIALYIVAGAVGLFVLLGVIGMNMDPATSARYDRQAAVDEACEKMMSDAALGNERRMTRQMCDELKARAARR